MTEALAGLTNKEKHRLERETAEAQRKAEKQAKKEQARAERNQAQAEEESKVWAEITDKADQALEIYKAKLGRPTKMTPDVQAEILDRIANGQPLAHICKADHMPSPAKVLAFIERDAAFRDLYVRARLHHADTLFDQTLAIADDFSRDTIKNKETGEITVNHGAIQRDRLRIDTRFRIAGKLSGKYADRPLLGAADTEGSVTVTRLTVNARDLAPDDRQKLREMLLAARADQAKVIDN